MSRLNKSYESMAESFDKIEKRMDRCLFLLLFLNGLVFGSLLTQLAYRFL